MVDIEIVGKKRLRFKQGLSCPRCGRNFEKPRPTLFSFNHPLGACPECKGFGNILLYDEELIIPNPRLSLSQGAIEPWTKPAYRWWQERLLEASSRYKINTKIPYGELSRREKKLVFEGGGDFDGIRDFFDYLEEKRYKMHIRVFLSRYRSPFPCKSCGGKRLQAPALKITIGGKNIYQLSTLTIEQLQCWFEKLPLSSYEKEVAREILRQIKLKLKILLSVGLNYLTLNRETRTLSSGEAQRVNLANQLASQLTGTLYVLDEPTIGLHPRDTHRLGEIVREMSRTGNTVVVVEHDRAMMALADYVVELGPWGGREGGEIVYAGPKSRFLSQSNTLTARYLTGKEVIPLPAKRRKGNGRYLELTGARENNLKNINLRIPLRTFTCITGVSGSGKSTLIHDTLYMALARVFRIHFKRMGRFERLIGVENLKGVKLIDQEPIGRTPRSNPITYIKAFSEIRAIFARTREAKMKNLAPGHFSFNLPAGRCPACQGSGHQRLEMYFFEDLYITCSECQGARYRSEILEVKYKGKTIGEVLGMTVDEAWEFFSSSPLLRSRLSLMRDVGLGYLCLGQPATTLSGGEAQRIKICAELGSSEARDFIYILDEPTTGLHFEDIKKLLGLLFRLVEGGNTVVVIEHHLEVIKSADYLIDLGPEGGDEGGRIIAEGIPEAISRVKKSYTGRFLKEYL